MKEGTGIISKAFEYHVFCLDFGLQPVFSESLCEEVFR